MSDPASATTRPPVHEYVSFATAWCGAAIFAVALGWVGEWIAVGFLPDAVTDPAAFFIGLMVLLSIPIGAGALLLVRQGPGAAFVPPALAALAVAALFAKPTLPPDAALVWRFHRHRAGFDSLAAIADAGRASSSDARALARRLGAISVNATPEDYGEPGVVLLYVDGLGFLGKYWNKGYAYGLVPASQLRQSLDPPTFACERPRYRMLDRGWYLYVRSAKPCARGG